MVENRIVGIKSVSVSWSRFYLIKNENSPKEIGFLTCKSNLYRLLTIFFFSGTSRTFDVIKVSKEDSKLISLAIKNKKKYYIWRKTMEYLSSGKEEKALDFFKTKIKLLALINL